MKIDIRENIVEVQYKNILLIAKETPRKYFVRMPSGYDFVPHIEIRFKDLSNHINRWFITPVFYKFETTLINALEDIKHYYCVSQGLDTHRYQLDERIIERLKNGDFDKILNCNIITGIINTYNSGDAFKLF